MKGGDWGGEMLEYQAIGTAVRRTGAPPPAPGREPFVSNLTGQDHWMLRKAGFRPVGFSFGNCTWLQYPDWRSMSWYNTELPNLTQAMYTARALAMERMDAETRRVGGTGILDVKVDDNIREIEVDNGNNSSQRYYIITFTAYGTAIAPDVPADDRETKLVVSLADPIQGSINL